MAPPADTGREGSPGRGGGAAKEHITTGRSAQQHVLVTGGGHGIGAAIAVAAAEAGLAVSVNDVVADRAQATVDRIRRLGAESAAVAGDVGDLAGAGSIVDRAVEALGDLSGLVNNAALLRPGSVRGLVAEEWEQTLRVNLLGVTFMVHAAAPSLARTGGSIVNLASVGAFQPAVGAGAYSASKAGVVALTRQLAIELGGQGIRVNAVAPGFVVGTDMAPRDPRVSIRRTPAIPLGREGRPEDIAPVVLFLLGPAAAYVTGAVLPVDGGLSANLLTLAGMLP